MHHFNIGWKFLSGCIHNSYLYQCKVKQQPCKPLKSDDSILEYFPLALLFVHSECCLDQERGLLLPTGFLDTFLLRLHGLVEVLTGLGPILSQIIQEAGLEVLELGNDAPGDLRVVLTDKTQHGTAFLQDLFCLELGVENTV